MVMGLDEVKSVDDLSSTKQVRCSHCMDVLTQEQINCGCVNHYGNPICEDCFDENYFRCADCGSVYRNADGHYVNDVDGVVCDNCINGDDYFTCLDCDEIFSRQISEYWQTSHSLCNDLICGRCFGGDYTLCFSCNIAVRADDARFSESMGEYFCASCYDDEDDDDDDEDDDDDNRIIHEHHYKPDFIIHRGKKQANNACQTYGIEIETTCGNALTDTLSLADSVQDKSNGFIYCKDDGSIIGSGFEMVSHPFTWDWLKENQQTLTNLLAYLKRNKCKSFNSPEGCCGYHIHISRNQFKSSLHLYKFMKVFYDFPTKTNIVAQRKCDGEGHWGSTSKRKLPDGKTSKAVKNGRNTCERYCAVNLQNRNTVEVRIFKGTLSDIGIFRGLEYCNAAIEFTKNASCAFTYGDFARYIRKNRKQYLNLNNWHLSKRLLDI